MVVVIVEDMEVVLGKLSLIFSHCMISFDSVEYFISECIN